MPVPEARTKVQRVRFVAEPPSVPVARRFVADCLTGAGMPGLAEDAELLVSELSANAALHSGSRFFDVIVQARRDAVRVAVEDDGRSGGITPRTSALLTLEGPDPAPDLTDVLEQEATTGRGLLIVAALADRWGVEETDRGKVVWGELDTRPHHHEPARSAPPERLPTPRMSPESHQGWVEVRLLDMPVALARRHDEHVWELVRELQLVGSGDAPVSRELATVIRELVDRHSGSWRLSQAVVEQGMAEGRDTVSLELVMPPTVVDDVLALQAVLARADEVCDRDELLTMASSFAVRRLRDWMTAEFVRQGRDGEEPLPWPDYRG